MKPLSHRWFGSVGLAALLVVLATSCGPKTPPSSVGGLICAQSLFEPGPVASLLMLRPSGDPEAKHWDAEVIRDPDTNVFHKGLWYTTTDGRGGILTISGNKGTGAARVKFWYKAAGTWAGETIYEAGYGGKQDRCRDLEIADVNGDGKDELIIVTHDQGVVLIGTEEGGKFTFEEIDRQEGRWIHEVEVGDVDGDGALEFFTTPSAANDVTGGEQPGWINMYRYQDGKYVRTELDQMGTRHAKEILCADVEGDGRPSLYAALEGENIGKAGGATTAIKRFHWTPGNAEPTVEIEEIISLPGKMCRFLNTGDTDGDGVQELIASTKSNGIQSVFFKDGKWQRREIASGRISKGFEHAILLLDFDGDGKDDVFAGSDGMKKVRRFFYDAAEDSYRREDVADCKQLFPDAGAYFIWNIMPLPPGK